METLFERLENSGGERSFPGFAIAPGIVTENFDVMAEGRVKVRIPSMSDFEPWARVSSVGAGSSRGLFWIPQVDDEVLVAFAQNDLNTAFVLGGLWSTRDRPPVSIPTDALNKRVIKTGISSAPGHEVEFDDLLQSIKIKTSTEQKIEIDPLAIKISSTGGTLTISLDNTSQTISIQAAAKLELKAPMISIEGVQVEIKGTTISVQSGGPCTVTGLPIKLN